MKKKFESLNSQKREDCKRKLSVALALVSDSKLVLLDEPTSGMDLTARRKLWEMLNQYKKDRIIILSTHNMDPIL